MHNARKIILVAILLVVILSSWFTILDLPASERIDAGLKRALISFATARALNAVISVAQGTELAVQPMGIGVTLTPGQILDPVNDLVEKFSSLMLVASVALGIQKFLINIGSNWSVSLLLTVIAFSWSWLYFKQKEPPRWLSRTLVILVMIRFAMPLVIIGSDFLFEKYLAGEYISSQQAIGKAPDQVKEFIPSSKVAPATEPNTDNGNLSFWQKSKKKVNGLLSTAKDTLDVEAYVKNIQKAAEHWTKNIINLIVIFLLQTLIIPFLLLWVLYSVTRSAFESPMCTGVSIR